MERETREGKDSVHQLLIHAILFFQNAMIN